VSAYLEQDLDGVYAGPPAESAVWRDVDRDHAVRVIFEDPFVAPDVHDGEFATSSPAARIRSAEAPSIATGHTLRITRDNVETTYHILEVQPTGYGEKRLRLSRDTGN